MQNFANRGTVLLGSLEDAIKECRLQVEANTVSRNVTIFNGR